MHDRMAFGVQNIRIPHIIILLSFMSKERSMESCIKCSVAKSICVLHAMLPFAMSAPLQRKTKKQRAGL